jgi:anti-sigma regulatory factor (Ser/Thr protein kinase)
VGRTANGVRGFSDAAATHNRPQPRPERELPPRAQVERIAESVAGPGSSPGTVSRALPADLTAVREARTVVQQVLGTWRADEIYDDVALVASELVANALRHGLQGEQPALRFPARPDRTRAEPEGVRISLVSTGSHVICAVTDPSEDPPVRRNADPLAVSGRGLQLVESLSLCWGWTVLDGDADGASAGATQGKSVWAIFPLELSRSRSRAQAVGAA